MSVLKIGEDFSVVMDLWEIKRSSRERGVKKSESEKDEKIRRLCEVGE